VPTLAETRLHAVKISHPLPFFWRPYLRVANPLLRSYLDPVGRNFNSPAGAKRLRFLLSSISRPLLRSRDPRALIHSKSSAFCCRSLFLWHRRGRLSAVSSSSFTLFGSRPRDFVKTLWSDRLSPAIFERHHASVDLLQSFFPNDVPTQMGAAQWRPLPRLKRMKFRFPS